MEKVHKLTVKEASQILDTTEAQIRKGMSQGSLPIGFTTQNGKITRYHIFKEMIEEFLGVNKKDSHEES